MASLLLDSDTWDLVVNAAGNIGVTTSDVQAAAQDVACACRLFLNELWYDTTQGIPYFQNILGKLPALGFISAKLQAAAYTMFNVTNVTVQISLNPQRQLVGNVNGVTNTGVSFSVGGPIGLPWYVQNVTTS